MVMEWMAFATKTIIIYVLSALRISSMLWGPERPSEVRTLSSRVVAG
jgi:hypothetical protein